MSINFITNQKKQQKNKKGDIHDTLSDFILVWVPSLIGAIFVSAVNYVKSKNSSYKLIKDGVIAILHNKIYTLGKQYIAQEHISVEALDDFEHLYKAYHALGGNGTGTEIYKRVKELPMKQGKE
ncbi:hypothetical protein [Eubacterium ventriosum]|uniref:hypothetical protein n=1 Tax=Eubacterium ventriosum TaxID=39496 RepID=UPI003522AEDD